MNKFARWMKTENLTDEVVAAHVGVTKMYVYKLRTGMLEATASFAWKFALAYGFGLARELFVTEGELV